MDMEKYGWYVIVNSPSILGLLLNSIISLLMVPVIIFQAIILGDPSSFISLPE